MNAVAWMGVAALAIAAGPAFALPTHDLKAPSLVVPVQDEEDMEVQRDLEPDEVPATKSGGEMMPAPDRAKTTGGGNVEDEELQRDLETGD
ncbi:hypothetical protein GL4_0951 [Methyloceanibacter caenitepidi]|uniref:Uncharacterized protein n=1 Tax=Methyloceanibacter caenitepidi TaxID=1384459 RepID=A0A0A8K0Y1_9HYPH|nr:hypothetical protein GL4_0951 [Methyloceanibacter caenitepidi]